MRALKWPIYSRRVLHVVLRVKIYSFLSESHTKTDQMCHLQFFTQELPGRSYPHHVYSSHFHHEVQTWDENCNHSRNLWFAARSQSGTTPSLSLKEWRNLFTGGTYLFGVLLHASGFSGQREDHKALLESRDLCCWWLLQRLTLRHQVIDLQRVRFGNKEGRVFNTNRNPLPKEWHERIERRSCREFLPAIPQGFNCNCSSEPHEGKNNGNLPGKPALQTDKYNPETGQETLLGLGNDWHTTWRRLDSASTHSAESFSHTLYQLRNFVCRNVNFPSLFSGSLWCVL